MRQRPYTIAEARQVLGITRSTIMYHIALGHLGEVSHKTIDGRWTTLIPAAAVRAFKREWVRGVGGRWRRR